MKKPEYFYRLEEFFNLKTGFQPQGLED